MRYIYERAFSKVIDDLKESNIIRCYLWNIPPCNDQSYIPIRCRTPIDTNNCEYWVSNNTRKSVIKAIARHTKDQLAFSLKAQKS
jgi:hypothetical protein